MLRFTETALWRAPKPRITDACHPRALVCGNTAWLRISPLRSLLFTAIWPSSGHVHATTFSPTGTAGGGGTFSGDFASRLEQPAVATAAAAPRAKVVATRLGSGKSCCWSRGSGCATDTRNFLRGKPHHAGRFARICTDHLVLVRRQGRRQEGAHLARQTQAHARTPDYRRIVVAHGIAQV